MKKILLLGGSEQQVIAIKTAKRLGYITILCDYLPDNPGQFYSDTFYLVSTTDKESVLEIALKEKIDGVIAYASDPAAPTASYVAEKMNLMTNPFAAVDILCNKDKFRAFLGSNGFNSPCAEGYSNKIEAKKNINKFSLPIIIKPVDSSGSKGVSVLETLEKLDDAIEFAFSFSKSKRIVIEEYIEKKHKYLVGGDIFVYNGKIVMYGLMNCHRDNEVNALVPVGKSYPLMLEREDIINVQETLQRLVSLLDIKMGPVNVELVIDKHNRVWPIDIGPRAGGNMIPDLLGLIYNVDIVEMSIMTAMGEKINPQIEIVDKYYATYNVHSNKNGIFNELIFSELIEKYIIRKCIYKKRGDYIEVFDNASKALGIIFLSFNNSDEMERILSSINEHIRIVIE